MAGAAIGAAMVPARVSMAAELTRGFEKTLRSYATGEEINRQKNIWVLEVQMKPMRMVFIDSRDPKTGEMKKEQVWYLAYRAINRPLLNRKADDDTAPVNDVEPLPGMTFSGVSAGSNFTCALREPDRAVVCFGSNEHGKLGRSSDSQESHEPQLVCLPPP